MNVDALRISREALGMTQTDLSRASGLEQSDIPLGTRIART